MKKWTMLLALLLATVFCFPGALAEQEAVESTGDNGGGQLVSHVYEPGDIASGLLAQAFGQEHGTMIVAEVRGEGIPLEAEMPDLVLRLGVAFSSRVRVWNWACGKARKTRALTSCWMRTRRVWL